MATENPEAVWADRPWRPNHLQPAVKAKTASPGRQAGGERRSSTPPKR